MEETPDYEPIESVLEDHDRLTIQFSATHQHHGDEAHQVAFNRSEILGTEVEPWKRRSKATADWKPVDLGWIDRPIYVVIKNLTHRRTSTPSPEELKLEQAQVIEVAFADSIVPHVRIPVGGAMPFYPVPGVSIKVRCLNGDKDYRVHAFSE